MGNVPIHLLWPALGAAFIVITYYTVRGQVRRLQAELRDSMARLQEMNAVLSGMVEGVVVVDSRNRIKSMNRAARALFGVSGTPEGRAVMQVIRNSDFENVILTVRETNRVVERTISVYSAGARKLQVSGSALPDQPDTLLVCHDVTRLYRLEQMRREFVANVSHELKTPITSIVGFVETLQNGALDDHENAGRFLAIVASQAQRLNAIIDDLLQLSRLEQNETQISLDDVEVGSLLDRVRQGLEPRAKDRAVTVQIECGDGIRASLNTTLMEQALTNLLDNAIKYSQEGAQVFLSALPSTEGTLTFSVTDNGPGISTADMARIFERFYRVDKARSSELGGTGLGLAIVKHIARAHGGSASVESTVGQGSRFTITVPTISVPLQQARQHLDAADERTE